MSVPTPRRSAQDELREQLMSAARREETSTQRVRHRRRRRGAIGGLLAVAFAGAAVAGAADLISTGAPVPNRGVHSSRYQPPGFADLVAKAKDPSGPAGWGVGIYTSPEGLDCAVAGQVRGLQLGLIRDGTFHVYERGTTGACGDLDKLPILYNRLVVPGAQPRTILYGRTRHTDRFVTVTFKGKTSQVRPARGGGFVFVFEGQLPLSQAIPRLGASLHR